MSNKKETNNKISTDEKEIWINPLGGKGDTLMAMGVLKTVFDKTGQQFCLARRTSYSELYTGHPAIKTIGHPPKDAIIEDTAYWLKEELGAGTQRPMQILARAFGLKTPIEEKLFLPNEITTDELLHNVIPWKEKNIVICPSSDSPRKMMQPIAWHQIVERLINEDDINVMQVGTMRDFLIRPAYSLLGLTTPHQLIALLRKCTAVITSDNFIMHAAHLVGIPAVVLWGPTRPDVYGYPEQKHIKADPEKCHLFANQCLGRELGHNYPTPCPLGIEQHCMNRINPEEIYNAVLNVI